MNPKHLAPLFWDTNFATFDPQLHPAYTIGRVLEHGDGDAVAWMRQTFPDETILGVLRTEHRLSIRSANFWALYFHIPASEVASLRS
ncbi:MAG: DUF6922 domain-containing protein [Terriglobales bacterium]